MPSAIEYALYTMCLVQHNNHILLINRPDKRGFPGYIAPGGKVEFPESLTEAAVRELREETGLIVQPEQLIFKGVDEYVVPQTNYRYMVFNYCTTTFEGELLPNPPEGDLHWVPVEEALDLPMQPWFRRRLPLFFEKGTFEISIVWDEDSQSSLEDKIRHLG